MEHLKKILKTLVYFSVKFELISSIEDKEAFKKMERKFVKNSRKIMKFWKKIDKNFKEILH